MARKCALFTFGRKKFAKSERIYNLRELREGEKCGSKKKKKGYDRKSEEQKNTGVAS